MSQQKYELTTDQAEREASGAHSYGRSDPPAVILGGTVTALSVARSRWEAGISVYVLDRRDSPVCCLHWRLRRRPGKRTSGARARQMQAQCASSEAWAGGRDSSASEVISSGPWAADSSTSVASSAERA